jgi:Lrp/AsnC family transcriptional regulator, leucine-responsive regulatory protein
MSAIKIDIDDINRILLRALSENARMSYAELGRLVDLSPPAVAERVRRLEEQGLVRGYRIEIDRSLLGYEFTAIIRMRASAEGYHKLQAILADWPEFLECYHTTGEDTLFFKVACQSIQHLDAVMLRLAPYGATTSALVLSTLLAPRDVVIDPPEGEDGPGQNLKRIG